MPTASTNDNDERWKDNFWKHEDGKVEAVIEIEEEPRHHISYTNEFTKIITIKMVPGDTTQAHRHEKDTIVFIMMKGGESHVVS
jgi:predicted metal-dependent enzyme (double-stranded beta helix superfamily)